ncbi:MAG TPA: hypothetical protein VH763_18290 [Gemmatimonadales bacterium]
MAAALSAFFTFSVALAPRQEADSVRNTVGDTIWLVREVSVPPGRVVRAATWDPADPVELLAPGRVITRGESAQVAYPVVVWRPGDYTLRPPGPLLLAFDGRVDSLPPEPVTLRLASVLPPVPPDSVLAPQPPAGFVPRSALTLLPLVILWGVAALLLLPLHWWWRRRGHRVTREPSTAPPSRGPPLERWADAGEIRAVAAAVTARLRSLVASGMRDMSEQLDTEPLMAELRRSQPDWPLDELHGVLRDLDLVRFGDSSEADVLALARRVDALEARLRGTAA